METYRNNMICISCGKETGDENPVCSECRIKALGIKREGILNLVYCPKCKALKTNKRWIYYDKGAEIDKAAAKLYSGKNSSTRVEATLAEIDPEVRDGLVEAEVLVVTDAARSKFHDSIPYGIRKESCQRCNRETGSYFEAIIQIRGITGKYSNGIDKVVNEIINMPRYKDLGITKISRKPEGVDIFMMSFKRAESFSKKLSSSHMSEFSVSKKLAGRDNGVDLFRYTYLVRLFDLGRGSVLRIDSGTYIVLSYNNRSLELLELGKGRRLRLDTKAFYGLRNVDVLSEQPMEEYSIIYRKPGEVQILSPNGMSTLTVKGKYDSNTVDVVSYQDTYYALPP